MSETFREECIKEEVIKEFINHSRYFVGDRLKEYIRPNEELYNDLEDYFNNPTFSCKAAELKITLELEKHNIWHKILVPINITFEKLHAILQIVFGWEELV